MHADNALLLFQVGIKTRCTEYFAESAMKYSVFMTCLSYIAAHYLEDGILKISYTMEDEGELIVASIDYFSDYNMKDCLGRTINYRIQDSDLPSKRYWSGEIKGELFKPYLVVE